MARVPASSSQPIRWPGRRAAMSAPTAANGTGRSWNSSSVIRWLGGRSPISGANSHSFGHHQGGSEQQDCPRSPDPEGPGHRRAAGSVCSHADPRTLSRDVLACRLACDRPESVRTRSQEQSLFVRRRFECQYTSAKVHWRIPARTWRLVRNLAVACRRSTASRRCSLPGDRVEGWRTGSAA
jgi:hypothetical protein